ncbi:uncharacterized protein ACIBXB_019061 [Morphnus guianensis]
MSPPSVTQRVPFHQPHHRSCRGYRPNGLCQRVRILSWLPTPKLSCRGRRSRPQLIALDVPQGARVSTPATGCSPAGSSSHLPPRPFARGRGRGVGLSPRPRARAVAHVLFYFGACGQIFLNPEGRAGSAEQWSCEPVAPLRRVYPPPGAGGGCQRPPRCGAREGNPQQRRAAPLLFPWGSGLSPGVGGRRTAGCPPPPRTLTASPRVVLKSD